MDYFFTKEPESFSKFSTISQQWSIMIRKCCKNMRKTGERFCLMSKCIKEKRKNYELVQKQLLALIEDETNRIANLSNAAALLNQFLDEINWVGFYLYEEDQLILGPFQGLPACVRIPMGKGVCGTSAATEKPCALRMSTNSLDISPAMRHQDLKLSSR